MNQRKLDKIRREWQKILRLQDWRIKIRFATAEELKEATDADAIGGCQSLVEAREANLLLLPPEALNPNDEREQDIENTIVHELLHCHFAAFKSDDSQVQLAQEQAIEAISEALVNLKRQRAAQRATRKGK